MAQIVPNGGTRESQDQFIGVPNELTVDQSNRELRLHDGSTPGGFRIPNLDTIEESFQQRSDELDGLKSFPPAARGLLVRLRAGVYAIRKFVGEGGLDLDNADGYDGNFVIRLGGEVEQDMHFKGDVLIDKVLEVKGGVNADTSGDHIGGLDARGATVLFDDKQIPASAVNLPAATSPFAIGMIMMWGGAADKIPAGWAICDGEGGTPNLIDRFVVGARTDNYGATGGSANHSHIGTVKENGVHSHTGEVQPFTLEEIHIPAHKHLNGVTDDSTNQIFNHGAVGANPQTGRNVQHDSGERGVYEGYTTPTGGGQPHGHGISILDSGNHTHELELQTSNNIPPYYALAYIMRVS